MRKLVFTLLVGASSLAGCTTTSGGGGDLGTITAKWSFVTVGAPDANGKGALTTIPTCPPTINTAAVHTTRFVGGVPDPTTEKIDLFTCSDMIGDLPRAPGQYETFIRMTSEGGGMVYGQSLAAVVDITTVDKTFTTALVDNGGYFQFDWILKGANTNATLDCAAANTNKVAIDSTDTVLGAAQGPYTTELPCGNGTGVTDPMVASSYAANIAALDAGGAKLGNGFDTTAKTLPRANGVADLGAIMVPIPNK